MSSIEIPLNLRSAVRSLQNQATVRVTGEWQLYGQKWALPIDITTQPLGSLVGGTTSWFVVADSVYPRGEIKLFPSKMKGITATYQHQACNGEGEKDLPWRAGKLCLDSAIGFAGRDGNEHEPFDASGRNSRLAWHVHRAVQWLDAAATSTLVSSSDPFELPEYTSTKGSLVTIAHSEDEQSYTTWSGLLASYGLVEMIRLSPKQPNVLLTKRFTKLNGDSVLDCSWGRPIEGEKVELGGWLRLPSVPVMQPWKAPETWADLWEACRLQGIERANPFWRIVNKLRDGKEHQLLIGFPMPKTVGGVHVQMHWQPITLPALSHGKISKPGFRERNDTKVHQLFDHNTVLRGSEPINWQKSENWSMSTLISRGGLPAELRGCKVTLLGCGTVGSSISEMLVRAGLQELVLIDEQTLEAGNLCRHTLLLTNIKEGKASQLATRLLLINPHVRITPIDDSIPLRKQEHADLLARSQLVIDCTANDAVLRHLSTSRWNQNAAFVSLWLGMHAKRFYVFFSRGDRFPSQEFNALTQPWLRKEREEHPISEFPRDGIGCWHPVFPARIDDVWMFAGAAIKTIEFFMNKQESTTELKVYEQRNDETGFLGLKSVKDESANG